MPQLLTRIGENEEVIPPFPQGVPLDSAIERSSRCLLSLQSQEGCWEAELEADTTLESDGVKLMHLLRRVDHQKQERFIQTILAGQLPDGGWPIYAGGPAELNATVKAYTALRLAGRSAQDPVLTRARSVILRLGGLARVNSFEKVYLALFGCYPWSQVPALPPELVLFPRWFPFNIYEIAYWSRTILVPLAVITATRPSVKVPFTLDELWVERARKKAQITNVQPGGTFWRPFFLFANQLLKIYEASPWKPWRKKALKAADQWIHERLVGSDGLGAIFPAMMNAVIALKGLGYGDGDPLFEEQVRQMAALELPPATDPSAGRDGEALKVQPCFSPVWDTAIAVYVLGKIKTVSPARPEHLPGRADTQSALQRAVQWLLSKEIRTWGDWAVKNPEGQPGGWAFQFRNPFYPDVDDTAQVLLALHAMGYSPHPGALPEGEGNKRSEGAFQRGLDWILSMQNKDGGFSSFDKDNDCLPLTHFPFADHNAMLDPSAADITGRILELFAAAGFSCNHPAVCRAVDFLKSSQEPDGTWFGRWSVNYIYGTWLALRGLKAIGESMGERRYQKAGDWLVAMQNEDGGWGEGCASYDDTALKGKGVSTASQTAWALMALRCLDRSKEPSFHRGLHFLLSTQQPDGNWQEGPFTGTGFPRVFYLKYHLYRTYFPLLALAEGLA